MDSKDWIEIKIDKIHVNPNSQGFIMSKGKLEDLGLNFTATSLVTDKHIDTNYSGDASDVKILGVPHKTVEEYLKLSLTELEELATSNGGFVLDYQTPDDSNYKYVGNGYINMDYPEGKYDILFTYYKLSHDKL